MRLGNLDTSLQVKGGGGGEVQAWISGEMQQGLSTKDMVIRKEIGVTRTILERMENIMLKWFGHLVRMEDNRWPKRILTSSPRGRRQRGRPDVKWEKEVERVMKQRNVISDYAVNWQVWLLNTSNGRTTGKLIIYIRFESKFIMWALRNRVSIPGRGTRFLCSPPKPPDRLCDPPSPKERFCSG